MSTSYIEVSETLYYLCRLDRYTPITSKYISWGKDVVTPLTQDELIGVILGNYEPSEEMDQRFYEIGVQDLYKEPNNFQADNNHSGYWKYGYVHALGRRTKYWNLDAPLSGILKDVATIDRMEIVRLAREVLMELVEQDSLRVTYMERNPDLDLFEWLEKKMEMLPFSPNSQNCDAAPAEDFYDAIDEIVLGSLKADESYDQELITLITMYCSDPNISRDEQIWRLDNLKQEIVYAVFPKNKEADGYYIKGLRTMIPSDAMRGAVYIGNICDVLEQHLAGQLLIEDRPIEEIAAKAYPIINFTYPEEMQKAMPSDWLSGGPYAELSFTPHKEYPQIGIISVMLMGYDADTEKNAVCDPSTWERFYELQEQYKNAAPRFDPNP